MSLPATDNFNRADGAVGANWTAIRGGGHVVSSNQCAAATDDFCISAWNADSFDNDQYSQHVVSQGPSSAYQAVPIRFSLVAIDGYYWIANLTPGTDGTLYRVDGGSFTAIQTNIPYTGPANADVLRVEAEGSDLRCYVNGVQKGSTQVDATYASGAAAIGVSFTSGGIPCRADSWEGGNLAPAVGSGAGLDQVDYRRFPKTFMRRAR